ncbi:MAG: tRNA lysidine(34) synthetase TilS [Chloroflexota bacterium]|nr:tRNA lysidine(34) synthetase TilS [Chloroflexota bacterium]
MLSLVARNIKEHNLIAPGQTVLVAVSGGADSVSLLHILSRLSQDMRFQIHVASLDHGIRGEAAARDVQHVRELATRWELPFTADGANAPALAKREGIGLEEAARRVRYDFLAELALRHDAACVAVGHHALDQVETILMRIVRGAGIKGLRGMRMSSPLPCHAELTLVRPLLNVTRDEIEAYCVENRLEYRHDSSNDDTGYLRNFIRHQIVRPLLDRHAHLPKSFERLAAAARADHDYLESRFKSDVLPLVEQQADAWRISRSDYQSCHLAMRRRLLREAFCCLQDRNIELRSDVTLEIIDWIKGAQTGKVRDLGRDIQLRVSYDSLYIERRNAEQRFEDYRLIAPGTEIPLRGTAEIIVGRLRIALLDGERTPGCSTAVHVPVDAELHLRTRRAGERFRPKGMAGRSRKIKDWMIDRKIPRQIRDQIPLVSLNGEVIAICVGDAWRLADRPQMTSASGRFRTLILE